MNAKVATDLVRLGAERLALGGLVAFPTETVYGLGADAGSDAAVAQIFAAKGRPSDHPLIVHVASPAQVSHFASAVSPWAQKLMAEFWPGALTVILPRRDGVATASAGGQASIGLRCPNHPVALGLLRAALARGVMGISGPSANRFGRLSPTTAEHVRAELGADLMVLDGGACADGIESAIVDCTGAQPVLLRPGSLTLDQLSDACGVAVLQRDEVSTHLPRSSGDMAQHYAPQARVRIMGAKELQAALDVLGAEAAHVAVFARSQVRCRSTRVWLRRMPADASATAAQLFAALREFDAWGAKLIWVETPPVDAAWAGVADRLRRAAA